MSNYQTTNDPPLSIGGATGHDLMHKDTRLSRMDRLTKPPPYTSWLELKALVDLDGIPSVIFQHLFFYTVTICQEYTFFNSSQCLEESAITAHSYIYYYKSSSSPIGVYGSVTGM